MSILAAVAPSARDVAEAKAREQLAVFAPGLENAAAWFVYRPNRGETAGTDETYLCRTWSAEAALAHVWAGNRIAPAAA